MFEAAEVKYSKPMKILGWMLVVFSIILFGVATSAYEFLQGIHMGGYWGAILTFIVGAVGAWSRNRCCVITGIVISIFALIVAVVAAAYTMYFAFTITLETGCYNTQTDESWGTPKGKSDAMLCSYNTSSAEYGRTLEIDLQRYSYNYNNPNSTNNNFFYNHPDWIAYYNANHYQNWYQTHNTYYWDNQVNGANIYYYQRSNSQCVCTDHLRCFGYTLGQGDDCGSILTTYESMLWTCSVFLYFLGLLTFVYSIFACCSACGSLSSQTLPVVTVTPVTMEMGTAVYVQPQNITPQYASKYAPVAAMECEPLVDTKVI